ncbi:MAG: hypothetical protein JSS47_15700 [Proteobacteria bacterium]|nr:hypothetical protein [Pseudomonadota bacterium]
MGRALDKRMTGLPLRASRLARTLAAAAEYAMFAARKASGEPMRAVSDCSSCGVAFTLISARSGCPSPLKTLICPSPAAWLPTGNEAIASAISEALSDVFMSFFNLRISPSLVPETPAKATCLAI